MNKHGRTKKFEQTLFTQTSLSQYKDFFYPICYNAFQRQQDTKSDHAELLSLSIR